MLLIYPLPFKGRVGVGMGWIVKFQSVAEMSPIPILTFPLKGKGLKAQS
jgi:hypothetical protein